MYDGGISGGQATFSGKVGWTGHYPHQNMNKAMHTGKVRKSWKNQSNESRLLYLHKRYRSSVGRKKEEVVPFLHKVESPFFCYEQKRKNFSFPFFFHPFFLLSALSFLHFVPPPPLLALLFCSSIPSLVRTTQREIKLHWPPPPPPRDGRERDLQSACPLPSPPPSPSPHPRPVLGCKCGFKRPRGRVGEGGIGPSG